MTIIKPAGALPSFARPTERSVRRGVIAAGAITRGELLDQERSRVRTDALGQLQELASAGEDVRNLSPQAYRARKKLALRLGHQVFYPRA